MALPCYYSPDLNQSGEERRVDLVVYGATAAGIIAAIEAVQRNLQVLVLNPGSHIGGMTTSGLGLTDVGNEAITGGLVREFYQRVGACYNEPVVWSFEPSVAQKVMKDMIEEAELEIIHGFYVQSVEKNGAAISRIMSTGGMKVSAKMFLDAGYEGDLMAAAGVSYATGREGKIVYGEAHNGVQLRHLNQFDCAVDPFVQPGDPSSGLLPGVHRTGVPEDGTGDDLIQAYNFRVCMTRRDDIRVPFPKPKDYDEGQYELLARYFDAGWDMDLEDDGSFHKFDDVARGKTDTNNHGGFSSDFIGGNREFPEASYEKREEIFQRQLSYHRGLLWFLQNSSRVPSNVQSAIQKYGLAGDEFTDTDNWPPQLYIRECRRMLGEVVVTEHHCWGKTIVEDPVSMAAYALDSHNCQRVVVDGRVYNEGDVQISLPGPFSISYRAMTPRREECSNLVVPVCASCSHIAYGSIRMEPVFMSMSQAAAIAADISIKTDQCVQDVAYSDLSCELRKSGLIFSFDQIPEEQHVNPENPNPKQATVA